MGRGDGAFACGARDGGMMALARPAQCAADVFRLFRLWRVVVYDVIMARQRQQTSIPRPSERRAAAACAKALVALRAKRTARTVIRVPGAGDVPLPSLAIPIMVEILERIACGEPASLAVTRQVMTTQHVADFLGVSRPFVVQLIDSGKLPAHFVGTHRRIHAADAVRYRNRQRRRANLALDELAELDRSLGLI